MNDINLYENSIINKYVDTIWQKFLNAINDFKLFKPKDKICVCISGGKDSMLMAKLFQQLEKEKLYDIEVKYLVMNPGYSGANLNVILNNLKKLKIEAQIVETDIFEIANMQEKNPCYLCAKMRRGALYNIAKKLGCNKIALGHHYDDVIETTLMNILNSGSFQTMLPKLHSTNYEGMELIRPMYYIREKDILAWRDENDLHFILCACKLTETYASTHDGSQRFATKELIKELKDIYPNVEENIFNSTKNVICDQLLGYKKGKDEITFLDIYNKKDCEN